MITERLMKPGNFTITLAGDAPYTAMQAVALADHIVVTATHITPIDTFAAADVMALSIYTGVVTSRPSPFEIEGYGLAWWMGSPDGVGKLYVGTAFTSTTLGGVVTEMVSQGILRLTQGSFLNTSLTTLSAAPIPPRYITAREILDYVALLTGGEWRVNHAGTLDTGHYSILFKSTTPEVVITRIGGSIQEGNFYGVDGDFYTGSDIEQFVDKIITILPDTVGTSTVTAVYRDFAGNLANLEQAQDGTEAERDAIIASDAAVLQTSVPRREISLTSDTYTVGRFVDPGDYVYLFDREAGLYDTANQINWQGELINPIKQRVYALTWPVQRGMGVYVRHATGVGTYTYTDLSDWVEWEGTDDDPGETTWEIGSASRAVADNLSGPSAGKINYLNPESGPVKVVVRVAAVTGSALTTSGSVESTVATLTVPDMGVPGYLEVFGHLYINGGLVPDTYNVHLKSAGTAFATDRLFVSTAGQSNMANVSGEVAHAGTGSQSITMTVVRDGGTGTTSTYADPFLNTLRGVFIPT